MANLRRGVTLGGKNSGMSIARLRESGMEYVPPLSRLRCFGMQLN